MAHVHRYAATVRWSGSTGSGYQHFDRSHSVATPPVEGELAVSGDPAFRGDSALRNPEQLLLAAAGSCQLLSFLALAARSGIDVRDYRDSAEAEMPVTREPMRITRIVLRPEITVAAGADPADVVELVHRGHAECFIANTLNAEMVIEPRITVAGS